LKEKDAQKLFAQLISGVDYLHKKHIVHRDLKLENLLLDKHRNIIITDFGFANRFDHEQEDLMQTSCGSPCYAAPELVVSEGLYVGSAVDIWSCGVILYAMLSGYLPYDDDPSNPDGDNISLLYKYIMSTRLNFPEQMSPSAKNLLQMMLVPNPELRCTISAIMEHPWLSQYTDLFARSPADHEYIFQETMYHKSQQAKRELSERRRVQEEAKAYKAMQRSQSSAPGGSVTAAMLDHNRRKDQRHQSAMPTLSGTTTMPMHLNNGGTRTPPLAHTFTTPVDMKVTASAPSTTLVAPIPLPPVSADSSEHHTFAVPEPVLQPIATGDAAKAQKPVLVSQVSETPTPSTLAVENESLASAPTTRPHTPPPRDGVEKKEPMSANKNRHTIQVEYDINASYERMQEDRGSPKAHTGPLEASTMNLQPVTSDIEMDSGSENDHRTEESMMDRISPDPSRVATPPSMTAPIPELAPVVPTTPTKASSTTMPTSPTTPRATAPVESEETMLTPRQKVVEKTPRASVQPTTSKRHESMPPTPLFNAAPTGAPAGLPVPVAAKRDRSRKGMSLDKLGLSRLLGQVRAQEDKPLPPSAFGQAGGLSKRNSGSRPSTSAGEVKTDKKSKRATMQLPPTRYVYHSMYLSSANVQTINLPGQTFDVVYQVYRRYRRIITS
jgi:protein-serine/threonine kinase